MTDDMPRWEEEDSARFLRFGEIFTPSRREQLDLLIDLVPYGAGDTFAAVDLGCGGGWLTAGILHAFPQAQIVALDGSESMLAEVRSRAAAYGDRLRTVHADLRDSGWMDALPTPPGLVVSSLAIHHLAGNDKRRLYTDLASSLQPGGAILLVDLVEPVNAIAARAYAAAWERIVVDQAAREGMPEAAAAFQDRWNHYHTPDVGFDMPSSLRDNLRWLDEAGLVDVDCFWLRAGHAMFGGYRPL